MKERMPSALHRRELAFWERKGVGRLGTRKQRTICGPLTFEKKHDGRDTKRPVADVLIEAFAQRLEGLITRNPKRFTTVPVVVP
jgi:hypothetical protein